MTAVTDRPRVHAPRTIAQAVSAAPRRRISPERIAAGLTLVVLGVLACVALARIDISVPNMIASWANAQHFFARVGTVRFPELPVLLQQTALTVGLVLLGTLLAAVLSVPIAYLAAANTSPGRGWIAAARFVSVLTRAVPDVVLAMVFVLLFTIGPLPGILAIGIHSIGMISKLFADAIEQIDEGPRTAIRATGGNRVQQFTAGVLPQVLPSWVATVLHRNDINLRGSVILGFVGIVGLGREMSFAFKSLDYSLGIGYAIVIFALCVLMEIVSSAVRATMLGRTSRATRGRPVHFRTPEEALRRPWTAARVRTTVWSWVAVLVVVGSVVVCDIAWGDLATVWGKIAPVAARFWPPSFGSYGTSVMLGAVFDTVAIALAATLLALAVSVVIGSFAARNVAPTRGVRGGARLLLVVVRGIPETILAVVLIVITGLGAQAGTLALAFGGIGLLGKLVADSLEEVAAGPERALTATGATRFQRYAGATVPQGIRAMLGHTFYLVDTNIRAATILGVVGGGGIGYYLLNAAQGSNYGTVTAIVLMILVAVLVVEGIAMWMRRVFR
ncbi:PhnE/PtxC family ABC transporter permease [Curtobacterium pusillum]|uniref:PhnE/PtxC family ABC transporter permease n=1 Tax=Curtobacterium pusillum TaxID=69373 RepID=UPI0011A3B9F3|nr:ABC transporter permease subunit [Curtobacterium pusillum]